MTYQYKFFSLSAIIAVGYPPTSEIMANIRKIEAEIANEMDEPEKLLK